MTPHPNNAGHHFEPQSPYCLRCGKPASYVLRHADQPQGRCNPLYPKTQPVPFDQPKEEPRD